MFFQIHGFLDQEQSAYNEHVIIHKDFKTYLDTIKMKAEELAIIDKAQVQPKPASKPPKEEKPPVEKPREIMRENERSSGNNLGDNQNYGGLENPLSQLIKKANPVQYTIDLGSIKHIVGWNWHS